MENIIKHIDSFYEWCKNTNKNIYNKSKYKDLMRFYDEGVNIDISITDTITEDGIEGKPTSFLNQNSKPVKDQKAKLRRLHQKQKRNKTNDNKINTGSMGSSLYEATQNLYKNVIDNTYNILKEISSPDIICIKESTNRDKIIIDKDNFISMIEFVHEGENPRIVYNCLYGNIYNGNKEIFPVEFVKELFNKISYKNIFIAPIDLCNDKFDIWLDKDCEIESTLKSINTISENIYKKCNVWCDIKIDDKNNNIIRLSFREIKPTVYGTSTPEELKEYESDSKFIKDYTEGFTLEEYYNILQSANDVSKFGWNKIIPITTNNILQESAKTKKRMASEIVLSENNIFKNDRVYNLDDFIDGKNNILLITGLPGSGKSTLASDMAKDYDAIPFELDCFHNYKYDMKNPSYKTETDIISKYIKENKVNINDIPTDIALESFNTSFVPFFNWLLKYLSRSSKRYIIEGIQIMLCIPFKNIKSYPLICIETSKTKSMIRRWKRDEWKFGDIVKYLFYELKMYNKWSKSMKSFSEASTNKSPRKHPIFIVCSYTGTPAGKIIRTYTHSIYTHSAISLDTSMEKLYSFNADNKTNRLGGFSEEKLSSYIEYNKDTVVKISCIFVSDREFYIVKKQLNKMLKNKTHTTYGYSDLINIVRNKSIDMGTDATSMVCSQFVSYIIQQADIDLLDKSPNLVTPKDLSSIINPKMYLLYEGYAKDYDKKKIDRIFRKLKLKAELIKESISDIL